MTHSEAHRRGPSSAALALLAPLAVGALLVGLAPDGVGSSPAHPSCAVAPCAAARAVCGGDARRAAPLPGREDAGARRRALVARVVEALARRDDEPLPALSEPRLARLLLDLDLDAGFVEAGLRTLEEVDADADLWVHAGWRLRKGGQVELARRAFVEALRRDPEDDWAFEELWTLDPSAALEALGRRRLDKGPLAVASRAAQCAQLLLAGGRRSEALAALQSLADDAPAGADYWAAFEAVDGTASADALAARAAKSCRVAIAVAMLTCAGPVAAQGSTHLVSRASDGIPAGDYSGGASVSADGRFVAFHCLANHLVPDDTNAFMDVFVQDRASGMTRRVSVASDGSQANGESWDPRVSGDGRFVTFWSEASNLVPHDTNGVRDVFVHDLQSGATVRASVSSNGRQADGRSDRPSLSLDGRYIVFHSFASNLDPLDANRGYADVFVRDLQLGTTTLVSLTSTGGRANAWCQDGTISSDGRFVAFSAQASNLAPGDTNGAVDVFVRDTLLGTTSLVSRTGLGFSGNGESSMAWVSGDGRFVAFTSVADDLVPDDTNGVADIFVHEIATGLTARVSLSSAGAQSTSGTLFPSLSIDGRTVAFIGGDGNLVPGDGNGHIDVFVRDLASGTTELASQSTSGMQGFDFSTYPAISGDGRYVAFESPADNLVELAVPAVRNVFLRDTQGCTPTGAVYCSAATTSHGCRPSISASGIPSGSAGAGFTITVDAVEGQELGLILYGCTGPAAFPFGGGSSVLCILGALQRTDVQTSGGTAGACDGRLTLDWNHFVVTHPDALEVPFLGGETVWAQAWFRDPLAPSGSNLSDALWFDVCS